MISLPLLKLHEGYQLLSDARDLSCGRFGTFSKAGELPEGERILYRLSPISLALEVMLENHVRQQSDIFQKLRVISTIYGANQVPRLNKGIHHV
jgi:hypothetical protein